jgi:hypothetical protein
MSLRLIYAKETERYPYLVTFLDVRQRQVDFQRSGYRTAPKGWDRDKSGSSAMIIERTRKAKLLTNNAHETPPGVEFWKMGLAQPNALGNHLPETRPRTQSKIPENECGDEKRTISLSGRLSEVLQFCIQVISGLTLAFARI